MELLRSFPDLLTLYEKTVQRFIQWLLNPPCYRYDLLLNRSWPTPISTLSKYCDESQALTALWATSQLSKRGAICGILSKSPSTWCERLSLQVLFHIISCVLQMHGIFFFSPFMSISFDIFFLFSNRFGIVRKLLSLLLQVRTAAAGVNNSKVRVALSA